MLQGDVKTPHMHVRRNRMEQFYNVYNMLFFSCTSEFYIVDTVNAVATPVLSNVARRNTLSV